MDFGELRQQQQESARLMTYQSSSYNFERRERKTVILDVADTASASPLSSATEFSVNFLEPLLIDRLSDVYIDSVLTHNSLVCHDGSKMAFSLTINEFNINSNSASTASNQHLFNRILIPNDHSTIDDVNSCVVHKGKKMNYVCSLNPCRIGRLSGKVTDLAGNSMFSQHTNAAGSPDGGIIHYIKLDTALTSFTPAGSTVSFTSGTTAISGASGTFTTAFPMDKDAVELYFYSAGHTVDASGPDALNTPTVTVGTQSGIATTDNTYRQGDFPRMIVEFVVISRD